ncbi:hypothetical protein ACFFSY_00760 [Paenibacillus aurantiacus]|uniref:Type VII secretion protein EssC n=1 Tax=Paenibacillus aurantiacus TaxID=1936118 RepID=A0ABV5KGW2_9BACL
MNKELSYFYYRRTPRIRKDTFEPCFELRRPPGVSAPPRLQYYTVHLPVVCFASAALAACLYGPIPHRASSYLAVGLAAFVIIAVIAGYGGRRQRTRLEAYEREVNVRSAEIAAHWASERERMSTMRQEEREALEETHPEPSLCLERAAIRISSVWERVPGDPDFLHLRAGIGSVPSRLNIILPKREGRAGDVVYASAAALAAEHRELTDMPVAVDVAKFRVIGITGDEQAAAALLRALVVQLATHHAPDEVKVAALFDDRRSDSWSWLRWLPHSWDDEREYRYLFQTQGYRQETMDRFLAELRLRRGAAGGDRARGGVPLPSFVCLVPNICDLSAHPEVGKLLLSDSAPEGICVIMTAPSRDLLPSACKLVIDLWPERGAVARRMMNGKPASSSEREITAPAGRFTPDQVTLTEAERFARTMAPYRQHRSMERAKETVYSNSLAGDRPGDVLIGQVELDGEKKPLAALPDRRMGAAWRRADDSSESVL